MNRIEAALIDQKLAERDERVRRAERLKIAGVIRRGIADGAAQGPVDQRIVGLLNDICEALES